MVKYTQTIRQLLPTNYLKVFDHFAGLTIKGLKAIKMHMFHFFPTLTRTLIFNIYGVIFEFSIVV